MQMSFIKDKDASPQGAFEIESVQTKCLGEVSRIEPDSKLARRVAICLVAINCIAIGFLYLTLRLVGGVLLLGDSLTINSETDEQGVFSFTGALTLAQKHSKVYYLSAWWGDRIADIRSRLYPIMDLSQPRAVVLFWDSDAVDVDELSMTPAQVNATRNAYKHDLTQVIRTLKSYGSHVVVTGPGVLLCCPEKDLIMDEYVAMNMNVSYHLGVDYIDVRRPLLEAARLGTDPTVGTLREHLNREGFRIVASLVSANLDDYWERHK